MSPDALDALLRRLRRAPLAAGAGEVPVHLGADALMRVLPHRPPFLLIDAVTAVDLAAGQAVATRALAPDDPVFEGHFPGDGVYPGVLLVECIGQLGLCLAHLCARGATAIDGDATPSRVRLIKIHGAAFGAPARPGDVLAVRAVMAGGDALTATVAGQVCVGGEVAAAAALEVYLVED